MSSCSMSIKQQNLSGFVHLRLAIFTSLIIQLFSFCDTNAQQIRDTLSEIKIIGKHNKSNDLKINEFSPGQKVKAFDSITLRQYQMQSIANLLTQQSLVFVKLYGINNLATINFRGASSAQSQVYWNGVPIQNAALGVADVSTLPVYFADNVNIVYGSSSALWGSGNVGGALMLENNMPKYDSNQKSLSILANAGSFNQSSGALKSSWSNRKLFLSFDGYLTSSINNFPYTDVLGRVKNMTNSKMFSRGIMTKIAYKINLKNTVDVAAWYQNSDRQIPPALFESSSQKSQNDVSLRIVANWERKTELSSLYVKSCIINDKIKYSDEAISLRTYNNVYQYYQEIGWNKKLNHFSNILLFIPFSDSWTKPQGTDETKQQLKVGLAGAYKINLFDDNICWAINARQETTNGNSVFLPGTDASYRIFNWLSIRANAQKTYRLPTLNELYFFPVGNTNLKPEQGWAEDAGYTVKLTKSPFIFNHDLSLFNRDIQNWIIWLGGALWTPHNIAEVHSRGVETENTLTYTSGEWKLHLSVNTSYVLATTIASNLPNDNSIYKQIPYTPRYGGQLNVGFSYKGIYLNYNHTYSGYRFITTDESFYLQPYQTGNVQFSYNTKLCSISIQLNLLWNNIWNEQFQIVAYRPMPGKNWQAGLNIRL